MSGTTDTGAGAMPAAAVDAPVTSESVKLTGTSEGAPDNAALVGEKKDPFGYVLKTPPRLLRKGVTYKNPGHPEVDDFEYIHDALRNGLDNLGLAIRAMDPAQEWHIDNIREWYAGYMLIVHDHHHIEETAFVPWVKQRGTIPERITADHKELIALLDEMDRALMRIKQAKPADRPALKEAAVELHSKLNMTFKDHLHEEEEIFPGQVREHYTVKEADAFGETIVKKLPLSLLHLMLPFAVEAFPAGKVDDMVNHKLPPPLRILLRKKWQHEYVRWKDLLYSVQGKATNPHMLAPLPGCWCSAPNASFNK